MSRVRGISKRMRVVSMEKIIPLFDIASLYHDCYLGVKIRYLAGDPELVNYNILNLSDLLNRKDTRQQALGLPISTTTTTADRVSNAQTQPPLKGPP